MFRKLALCSAIGIMLPVQTFAQDPAPTEATETPAAETPAPVPVDPATDSSPKDVADSVSGLIDATRTGSVIAIIGGVIMLLLNLFRLPQLGSITNKIPSRWRLVIAVGLGGVGGILSSIAGGMPWYEAIAVGLFSGPTAVFAHEAVLNTMFGKRDKKKEDTAEQPT